MKHNKDTLYCIVPIVDVTQRFINVSLQTSINTLRLSLDDDYALFKFHTHEELAKDIFADYKWLQEKDMKKFLNTDSNWTAA